MPKVLLATEHQAVRQRFEEALSLDGHSFDLCRTGSEVEASLRRDLPDIVIADVDLPGLDAFELVGLLTSVAAGRAIPPVVMRSNESADEEEDGHFVFMGGSDQPEDLRALVRARLAAAEAGPVHGTVLVADDDWSLRKSLQVRLQNEGYEVLTAMDGLEAFERLSELPDLVLTDVDMPGLDGLGLVQRMRSTPSYREIPAIIMTAHATAAEEAAEGLKLGANDYVRKPFEWLELSAVGAAVVGSRRDRPELQEPGASGPPRAPDRERCAEDEPGSPLPGTELLRRCEHPGSECVSSR